ncbi:unnamed protein product [Thelazia callipaeda]|uniref:Probable glutamine--tRNA ligase n=1 Tax=Thelazia callipaeda TaxID=103827 RepID=A0A158RBQ7_THECL|nr:unnamed protein product [Thelazia callipaeda]
MTEELKWLNLSNDKVAETLKNSALTQKLLDIIAVAKNQLKIFGAGNTATKQQCTLLYHVGTRLKSQCHLHMPLIVRHIINGNIRTEPQLAAAIEYLLSNVVKCLNEQDFLNACGVGFVVTTEDIKDQVKESVNKFRSEIMEQRYFFNSGKILKDVKSKLKWADGSAIKQEVDLSLMLLLGPKTVDELSLKKGKLKDTSKQSITLKQIDAEGVATNCSQKDAEGADTIEELMRNKVNFHKVGENYKTDGYVITPNTSNLLKKHVEDVKGKVVTRFPPEPNGLLHIGHAKAINIDFGYAKAHGGICYLRFDDTNPENEEEEFMENITEMVNWLGYKPHKITHSSDYFEQLYEWAIVLIKENLAYVCHQSVDEIRGFEVTESPWRNRPVEESLQLFQDMRRGKFEEGEATLRLKVILEEGKVDPVAYRIKYCTHHRTGNKWLCIYPTYDYTHCLCDSLENITHSLCTKEFQSRRSTYYWLCNALNIYCPVQWEYGRLNMYYTVVSKRKIKALIDNKKVSGWDDPRLFTLTALRRRGIPPEAINNFIARLGLSTAQVFIDPQVLDATVRDYLNTSASRTMAVLYPLKVTIENADKIVLPKSISVPDFPNDANCTNSHLVAVDRTIFIEQSDYKKDTNDRNFRRLTKNQSVGLKYLGIVLSVTEELMDGNGEVTEIKVSASQLTSANKPKAFIHWVANPIRCEVRLYNRLFKHKNPEDSKEVPNGFLSDCSSDSLQILDAVYIDKSISNSVVYDRYQFERVGYFSVDPDSTSEKLVFNRTVDLKEDGGKKLA